MGVRAETADDADDSLLVSVLDFRFPL